MPRMFGECRNFSGDRRGAISILTAAALPLMVGCLALAVDLGTVYLEKRTAQGIVDLAAMNAAQFPDDAEGAARATLAANALSDFKTLTVVKGNYEPNAGVSPEFRFASETEPYNAVRVILSRDAHLAFAAAFSGRVPQYTVQATAGIANAATFSVGSRLAAVRGGIANSVLGALAGTQINLSVMDYQALVAANVRIDDLLNAAGLQLGLTGVTYNQVLDADMTLSALAGAVKACLSADGNAIAAGVVDSLQRQLASSTTRLKLRWLLDLGTYAQQPAGGQQSGLAATVDSLSVLRAAMQLAGGGRLVTVDLALSIPNVTRTTLTLAIGERQQYSGLVSVGQTGAIVRTSQLKLRILSRVGGGTGALAGVTLNFPIYAEAAYAEARLASVDCGIRGDDTATIATTPGLARAAIADVTDAQLTATSLLQSLPAATLASTSLLNIRASADVRVQNLTPTNLVFSETDVEARMLKRTETSTLLGSLATSLLSRMSLNVQVLGLGLGTPSLITTQVANQLAPLAAPLDDALHAVMELLGVHLGEADVMVHGIKCGGAALVD